MQLTLFTANCAGNKVNCSYPNKVHVTNTSELQEAVRADHVCAAYKENYRSNDNFISSDCMVMDIDNDHSENPADWITTEKIELLFEDVDYVLTTSRHHMISKEGKTGRPKYHIYFPIVECSDANVYGAMKVSLQKKYPFFDDNALDAARFLFGAESYDVVWHEGWLTIDDLVEPEADFDEEDISPCGPILEGSRNNTMSRFAGRVLKRYGITEKSREAFLKHAKKCDPPLPDEELDTIWASAIRFFNKKVVSQEGYILPDEYNVDFEGSSLKPEDYSDIGEAKVLVREYGNELKYTNATDYLRYDGDCWQEDRQLAIGAVEEFLDLQLADAQDELQKATEALIGAGVPEEIIRGGGAALAKAVSGNQMGPYFMLLGAQSYLKFVLKRRDYKFIVATANTAKPMLAISISELDKDENLLNTPGATYNLKNGIAGEQSHDSHDLITKMTTCSPGEEGKQLWLDTLDLFFCKDQELINYVQQVVGMASIGKVYQEHMIIAYGGGANGKSTFWNTISRILGSYSGKISAEALTMNCKRNVKPEMAELKGKRLIIASEIEEGTRLNTGVVKQLSSTDEIQAEKKYKDPFKFVPSHTLVLYTNHLPKVGANDDGIWRRLIVIPFNAKITGKSDIKNFADYLFEHSGPAIMKWIIEGAQRAIAANFKAELPSVVKEAIKAYREDNDWLGQFVTECCEQDPSYKEKSGDVYQAYRAHCMLNGEFIRSTSDFYSAMDKVGFVRRRSSKGVQVHGLKLKEGQDFLD